MSVDATGAPQEPEALVLGADPSSAISELFGFLMPEEDPAPAGEGGAQADPAAPDAGQHAPAGEGAGGAGGTDGAPAGGAGAVAGVPPTAGAAGAAPAGSGAAGGELDPLPGVGSVDAASLNEKWGEVATAFEENQGKILQESALEDVRAEFPKHFEHVQMHPRQLVGIEVPKVNGEPGMEKIRDAEDAASWQEAMKRLLVSEVQGRAASKQEELSETYTTIHASIDLFRNNVDMIPGTKQFDGELAKQFVAMTKEYELRADGKLVGYSVNVQPLINQIRAGLVTQRAAAPAPAAPAGPTAQQQRAAEQARNTVGQFDAPQGGILSRQGSVSGTGDDVAAGVMDAFFRQNGVTM